MKPIFSLLFFFMALSLYGQQYEVVSPDRTIKVFINTENKISFSIRADENELLAPSEIAIDMAQTGLVGWDVNKVSPISKNGLIKPIVPEKFSNIQDQYNELSEHIITVLHTAGNLNQRKIYK